LRWVVLVVVGSAICTYGDHLHATHGVLAYRKIDYGAQAWWVPFLFAAASLVTVLLARPFVALARARGPLPMPDIARIAADGIGFFAAYAYTSFAPHERPSVTLAVLVIAFLVRVVGDRRPLWQGVYCILLGLGGVITEATISATGVFWYLHPDFLGTTRWLAGIYLHAGLLASDLATGLFSPRGSAEQRT
jgi:hypothetical protein